MKIPKFLFASISIISTSSVMALKGTVIINIIIRKPFPEEIAYFVTTEREECQI